MRKHNHKFVEAEYLKGNIKLLSLYIGALVKNNLECLECNFLWKAAYNHFKSDNSGCPRCSEKLKPTHEFVKDNYIKSGIKLLSIYQSNKIVNDLECIKFGHKWKAAYNDFNSHNNGCPECWKLSNRGENHSSWNHELTKEDRENSYNRSHTPDNRLWREAAYNRDGHTCQCCNIRGGSLEAHHIDSWKDHKDDRFNIDNGVTLCETCHKAYHKACHKRWKNEVNHNSFYCWIAEQSIIKPSKWSWVILYPESMNVWLECFKR